MSKYDKNGSGSLDPEEYLSLCKSLVRKHLTPLHLHPHAGACACLCMCGVYVHMARQTHTGIPVYGNVS